MKATATVFAIIVVWGAGTAVGAPASTPTPTPTYTPMPTFTPTATWTPTGTPVPPFAYINHGNDDIAVIDTSTDTVVTYMASDPGLGVTAGPSGAIVYVTNFFFDSVSFIDTSTQTIVDTFPVGDGPVAIAVDPTGNRLYVHLANEGSIKVLSAATGANVGSIPLGALGAGVGLAMHPNGAKLYANIPAAPGEVKVIATASNTVIDTIPVGDGPNGVVVNPAGTRLYVANQIAGSVSVVDTATDSVVDTITTGGGPYNMAVHPDGTRLYVGNLLGSSVFVIDTGTNSVVTTINIGNLPNGLSVLPDGTKLYVTNRGDDNVSVIDTATNAELYRIPVGDQPTAIGQFITGVQSNSASTIAATGTLNLPLTTFTGSLVFDPMTYSVFGTPVDIAAATGFTPMTAAFNLIGYTGGGLDLLMSATSPGLPSFSLSGPSKLVLPNDTLYLTVPVLTPTGTVLPHGPVYTLLAKIDRVGTSPTWSGPFVIHANAAANTPTGSDVVVPVTANVVFCPASLFEIPVSVEFDSVSNPGTTLVTGTCRASGSIPPNIRLDVGALVFFFDVSTTAGYEPPITVCGSYPDETNDGVVDGTGINETTLELLHDVGGAGNFQPVSNHSIDTDLNRICGEVTSLSPFLLASEGVPKGFVPPDAGARKCENKLLKQSSNLLKGIIKCNRKTAEAALKGTTFDAEACEAEARAKYDDRMAGLSGCPACLLANTSAVGDAAESAAEALTGGLYCAGATILGGEDLGFVPADTAGALCAKQQGKHAAKLGKNLGKCYRKHVDAVFKAKSFDLDACLAEENAAFDNAVGVIAGCPACTAANAAGTRNQIERFSVEILSDVYCAGTTALP